MQTRRDVFQAIADPIRRDIIGLVARQPMNLNSIAENFSVSRPAISQHIKVLTECGLVFIVQQGRERFCEARLTPLGEVADWIEPLRQRWEQQFTALDRLLDRMQAAPVDKKGKTPKNNKKSKP